MPNKYFSRFLAGLLLISSPALCQVLTVGTATMKVPAGATLTVGNLMLQPSATLALSNNSITGSPAPVVVNGVESIDNVFTFSTPVTFSGTAALFYTDAELDGNTATALRIAYNAASGGTYTLNCSGVADTTLKKISSSFLSGVHLHTVTSVQSTVPIAGIMSAGSVCVGATITLTESTPGGVWSSSHTSIATVSGAGIVKGMSAGTATISYTKSNSCGSTSVTTVVTVNAAPTAPASITGTRTVCAGSSTTLMDAAAGGAWSSSNTGIATVGSTGIVRGISGGTATISYLKNNTCGSAFATAVVTVNPLPVVSTITGSGMICAGGTTTLANTTAGGIWSSLMPVVATVSGTGVVQGVSSGTAVISYTKSNSCGSSSVTTVVTVNAAPTAPAAITGIRTVCAGSTTDLNDETAGGVWSSSNTARAIVSGAGIVTGVSAGTVTITYTKSNSCGSAHVTAVVTINALPTVAAITGSTTLCGSGTITLSDATPGGVWSSSNTGIATVSSTGVVHGSGSGSVTISYSVTNSHGCSTTVTKEIGAGKAFTIVASAGAGGSISPAGATSVCAGESQAYTITAASGYIISSVVVDGMCIGVVSTYTFGSVTCNHTISAAFESKGKGKGSRTTGSGNDEIPDVIKVYPNPTDGLFSIEIPAVHTEAEIVVTDLSGKIIYTRAISENTGAPVQVSLGNVASGMYFVKVTADETSYVEKLIVR